MEMHLVTRDGVELSRHSAYYDACASLHRIQGQSIEWACRYAGYKITKIQVEEDLPIIEQLFGGK